MVVLTLPTKTKGAGMNTPERPSTTPTVEERLEAMEYFLGQLLLSIEVDSTAIRAHMQRLESAIVHTAQLPLSAPSEEEEVPPLTVESVSSWMQLCVERMRAHQSVSARRMVAIGELVTRVASLGATLAEEPPPPIGADAQAAIGKAQRPPPTA